MLSSVLVVSDESDYSSSPMKSVVLLSSFYRSESRFQWVMDRVQSATVKEEGTQNEV